MSTLLALDAKQTIANNAVAIIFFMSKLLVVYNLFIRYRL